MGQARFDLRQLQAKLITQKAKKRSLKVNNSSFQSLTKSKHRWLPGSQRSVVSQPDYDNLPDKSCPFGSTCADHFEHDRADTQDKPDKKEKSKEKDSHASNGNKENSALDNSKKRKSASTVDLTSPAKKSKVVTKVESNKKPGPKRRLRIRLKKIKTDHQITYSVLSVPKSVYTKKTPTSAHATTGDETEDDNDINNNQDKEEGEDDIDDEKNEKVEVDRDDDDEDDIDIPPSVFAEPDDDDEPIVSVFAS